MDLEGRVFTFAVFTEWALPQYEASRLVRVQTMAESEIDVLDLSRSWSRKRKSCTGRLKQASKPLEERRIFA